MLDNNLNKERVFSYTTTSTAWFTSVTEGTNTVIIGGGNIIDSRGSNSLFLYYAGFSSTSGWECTSKTMAIAS